MSYPIVDTMARNLLTEFGDHSISLAISHKGDLIYSKGFGYINTSATIPTSTDTRYRIASVSKPITSTAIHILIERGILDYNDLVFGTDGILSLSGLSQESLQAIQNITVDQLLLHSSGLTRSTHHTVNVPAFEKTHEFIEYVINKTPKLDFKPGSQYSYSNIGYILLAEIITQVSGKPYSKFVADEILKPLGINSIVPGDENQFAENEVTDYQSVYNKGHQTVDSNYYQMEPNLGAGGWVASPEALLKFLSAIKGHSEVQILKKDTIDNMLSPTGPNPHMARGWEVWPGGISHMGGLVGQGSYLVGWDNDISYAVIANRSGWQWNPSLQEGTETYRPKLAEFGERAATAVSKLYFEADPSHIEANEATGTNDFEADLNHIEIDAVTDSNNSNSSKDNDDSITKTKLLEIENHGNIHLLQGDKKLAFAKYQEADELILITNKRRKQYSTKEGRWRMLAIEGSENEAQILWLHNSKKNGTKLKTYPYRLINDKLLGVVFAETSGRSLEAYKLDSVGAQKLEEEFGVNGNSPRDTTNWIKGSAARDRLNGTQSDDQLFGYESADRINGKGGDDLIDPGLSTEKTFDKVKGGSGSDTFIVKDGYHLLIKDFEPNKDILNFSAVHDGYKWEPGQKSTKIYDTDGHLLVKMTSTHSQDSASIII